MRAQVGWITEQLRENPKSSKRWVNSYTGIYPVSRPLMTTLVLASARVEFDKRFRRAALGSSQPMVALH